MAKYRITESNLHRIIKETIKQVLSETKEWEPDEFVDYEEYAYYGIGGDQRERNWQRSERLKVPIEDRCPLCSKPLKDGSYKTLTTTISPENGVTQYRFNHAAPGEPMKVGNGCFKNLMKAYRDKYNK